MSRSSRWHAAPSPFARLLALVVLASAPLGSTASLFRRAVPVPGVLAAGDFFCKAEGLCLPCPAEVMHTPVCKMYGNRRPLSCIPRRNAQPVSDSFVPSRQDSPANSRPNSGNNVKADSQAKGADGFDESGRLGETANGAAAHERPGVGGEKLSPAQQELKEALENDRRRRRSAEERQTDEREWERLSKRQAGVQLNVDAWEACPKVLASEYHDYFEFILCNAAFAAIAGIVLVFRQRALALRQFGRLAARIMQTQVS